MDASSVTYHSLDTDVSDVDAEICEVYLNSTKFRSCQQNMRGCAKGTVLCVFVFSD